MSTLREAAQQALEALKPHSRIYQRNAAIEALSAALEKQEQGTLCNNTYGCQCPKHFTHPPRREWRGLSKDESLKLWGMRSDGPSNTEITSYARAIEAALKERNI